MNLLYNELGAQLNSFCEITTQLYHIVSRELYKVLDKNKKKDVNVITIKDLDPVQLYWMLQAYLKQIKKY